ncbi:MAG TPA: diacylglycerol kinase [Gammaproteobacteria bacterium]|nr:diacylglycerol kinase [Gammaproteobacteria bacterium]
MKNQPFPKRLGFALEGLKIALRGENSFRLQAVAVVAVLAVLAWRRPAPLWWAVVALAVVQVLAAELVNTAVEHLADHLHPEQHPRIKIVKDCAAAAVLVASLGALGVAAALAFALVRG